MLPQHRALLIYFFHPKAGPSLLLSHSDGDIDIVLDFTEMSSIPRLLDLFTFNEGTIILRLRKAWAINKVWEIPSQWSRGNKESLLVSFIKLNINPFEYPDKDIIDKIENELNLMILTIKNEIRENYKALYIGSSKKEPEIEYSYAQWLALTKRSYENILSSF
jgi:hypothetical protein